MQNDTDASAAGAPAVVPMPTDGDAAEPIVDTGAGDQPSSTWWARRWRGQPGRLEVWYATMTDRETGTGVWVHGETVAPTKDQGGPVISHGVGRPVPRRRRPGVGPHRHHDGRAGAG